MYLLPTTELEAVNTMLESIGEQPVNTLVNSGVPEVDIAYTVLTNISRDFQAKGWHFNTETNFPLSLDVNNNLMVPANTLRVDSIDTHRDVTLRGIRLYDKEKHTYFFSESLNVDIVLFLDFMELPQAARSYLVIRASRDFQKKLVGSDTLYTLTKEDEVAALQVLQDCEDDCGDYNIFNSYDTARPINRNQNPYGRGGR